MKACLIAILYAVVLLCSLAPAVQKQESAPAQPDSTPKPPGPLGFDTGRQLFVDDYMAAGGPEFTGPIDR